LPAFDYDGGIEDAGMLLDGQGPGGVKIVTTSSTGKNGMTGRPFVCRRPSPPVPDAAGPSQDGKNRYFSGCREFCGKLMQSKQLRHTSKSEVTISNDPLLSA